VVLLVVTVEEFLSDKPYVKPLSNICIKYYLLLSEH
jgi:hypothetical protein